MKRTYLDFAAASYVEQHIVDLMSPLWSISYGNPSAVHFDGILARRAVEAAREKIATTLGVSPKTCIFVGTATESIALGLKGSVQAWKKSHPDEIPELVLTPIEHDAVLQNMNALKEEGAIIRELRVNAEGIVDVASLYQLLSRNTVCVSVGLVNNEIGVIQPIDEIAKEIRRFRKVARGATRDKSPKGDDIYPILHTDATQAVNYHDLNIPRLGVDLLTCNSSKIYGPKGVALLYKAAHVPIESQFLGGNQEFGLRPGTEPVALIVGFAEALFEAQRDAMSETIRLLPIRDFLATAIADTAKKLGLEFTFNGAMSEKRVVNNINVSFSQVDHEYLVILLDTEGFSVSTKSACNERVAEESHVLQALFEADGINRPLSGLRISMGRTTTRDDIKAFCLALEKVLPLAKYK